MLVVVLNMPEHSSFQDMLFPMLFISKYAKSYASIMDINLNTVDILVLGSAFIRSAKSTRSKNISDQNPMPIKYGFFRPCLWDRNPGFLKSEIGPFSGFNKKSYLMGLKSSHFQESDYQESGEVDRFLKMGTHFQERSSSFENGFYATWSGVSPRKFVSFT